MRNVVITGVGQGIGLALAKQFLTAGDAVIGTVCEGNLPLDNPRLTVIQLDLRRGEGIIRAADQVLGLKRPIDILINNAGVLLDEDETVVRVEKLRATLEVNLVGAIDWTERLLSGLSPTAHIVNISSTAGSLSLVGQTTHFPDHYPAYKISKAALNMYTRTLARRLTGITVSAVHPGWVRTTMGGKEADLSPDEAAAEIFKFSISRPPTGGFWFKGQPLAW